MSDDIDIFVSNGTCYAGIKLLADPLMIPCGNVAVDHIACCQASDFCLESSVCFNAAFGVTYISGCTDPKYDHPSCPNKFSDTKTPWLGLSYCNKTSNEWVLCDQKKKPAKLTQPDPCYCPTDEADRSMIISQSSIIQPTATLPTSVGESIQFFKGYYPSFKSSAATTTASITDTATTSSSLSSSPTDSAVAPATATDTNAADIPGNSPPSNESGLSSGAKIGTIVGAAAGTLVMLAIIGGLLSLWRRRRQQQLQNEEEARAVDNFIHGGTKSGTASEADPLNLGLAVGTPKDASHPNTPTLSELGCKAARPWSLRSELDPDASTRSSSTAGHGALARPAPSELAAHPIAELPG
ncbi:hypothetical protein J7T55_001009 [Diaporthe amygdali]|uniref:uncharacterized protein n=1 Tax=Phomopsis amygdali TaxID=1214568 RepID=UPI0022FEA5A7|nr:uncharacterized protein J7T55_001009 [Diaporthe amygdali]KAJ0120154.1 hypothetical protein J7T55_001009 [Diaporthe amygdali]